VSYRGNEKFACLARLAAAAALALLLSPRNVAAGDSVDTSDPIMLARAPKVSTSETVRELRKEIEEERARTADLEKRLDQVEQQQQTQAKTISEIPKLPVEVGRGKETTPGIKTGLAPADIYEKGFYLRSEDKSYSLYINGMFQNRFTVFKANDVSHFGALDNYQNTFDVFLGRLAFSGSVFEPDLKYFAQTQVNTAGNSNGISMLDWFTSKTFNQYLTLQTGRSFIPYTYEYYDNPGNYLFADLSTAEYAFLLQRAIGFQASGQVGKLGYAGEVMNSVPALDAGGQESIGTKLAYLGHLHYDLLEPYGWVETDPSPNGATKPQLTLWLSGMYNPVDYATGFQNALPGDRTYGGNSSILFRYGQLSFQGTGYYRRTLQTGKAPSYDSWGYGEQAGYYLIPARLELAERITGVWWGEPEIGFSGGNQNNWFSGPTNFPYHRITEYTAGLNYYLYGHNAKIQADYSYLAGSGFDHHGFGANRLEVQTQVMF